MKKLYLVDASNMFFRAFYAVRPLSTSKGLPTNALYGFMQMTIRLLRDIQPDFMAYCFDSKEPNFRNEIYKEYKANRTEMPEDLVPQMPFFTQMVESLGIPCYQKPGVEADDIIGTFTKMARKAGHEVVIVSGDKDFAQLVDPFVTLYDTMKEKVYDELGVKEKWGVTPEQMIEYLALVGDASDNVPGVFGVGPKTALKLLTDFGSLEGIYQNVDKIKGKLQEKVRESKGNAFLSKELVTIKTDLDLSASMEDLKLKTIDRNEVMKILEELEFKGFERKIFGSKENQIAAIQVQGNKKEVTGTLKEVVATAQQITQKIKKGTELWGLQTERGFYLSDEKTVYLLEDEPQSLGPLLSSKNIQWKGAHLKNFWKATSMQNPTAKWDQHLAAYVVNPSNIKDFASIYKEYTARSLPDFPSASDYIQANMQLENILSEKLKSRNGERVYNEIELPLAPVLLSMEQKGIGLDVSVLKEQGESLREDIQGLEKEIYEMSGETFNIASPKQLGHVLFDKLGLQPLKKTKTGYSTNSEVLQKLSDEHPICLLILDYRELTKLKSTYVDALPHLVNPETGRIHTVFNQAVTTTGRLSSQNPNLQNIPIRTERGNAIRYAFVAGKGNQFISSDYSQIELRILAHVTGDKGLVTAFEKGLDIHKATAAEVFAVKLKDVTSDMRRVAKAVNFGLAYGMSAHGLSENLNIPRKEAADIIKKYFQKFSGVQEYMHAVVEKAKEQGFVENEFGRRRYLEELKSKNHAIRTFGERAAINAPMQGTASDIVKLAMIDLHKKLPGELILQVHDELVFESKKTECSKHSKIIKDSMESVMKLKVPLVVQVATGSNWAEAHS